jgi:hypothetical protein
MNFCMMIPSIVRDHHNPFAFVLAPLLKKLQEIPEALPVKALDLSPVNELPVTQAHRPKGGDALARGVGARSWGFYLPEVSTCGTGSRIAENGPRPMPIDQGSDWRSALGVFFILSLSGCISSRNYRPGFHQAKAPLAEESKANEHHNDTIGQKGILVARKFILARSLAHATASFLVAYSLSERTRIDFPGCYRKGAALEARDPESTAASASALWRLDLNQCGAWKIRQF